MTQYVGAIPESAKQQVIGFNTYETHKNYIINPDFKVNQRAFAGGTLAGGVYGFDRWKAQAGGTDMSVSGITATVTSGVTQRLENVWEIGDIVTISWEGTAIVEWWDGVGWNESSANYMTTKIINTNGIIIKIRNGTCKKIKLENGSIITPFEYPDPASEFTKCERYYQVVLTGSYIPLGMFRCGGSGAYMMGEPKQFRTHMRAAPSYTFSATPTITWLRLSDETSPGTVALGVSGLTDKRYVLNGNQTGVNGKMYTAVSSVEFNINFSADL